MSILSLLQIQLPYSFKHTASTIEHTAAALNQCCSGRSKSSIHMLAQHARTTRVAVACRMGDDALPAEAHSIQDYKVFIIRNSGSR
jgi:hypothetical protein